MSEVRIIHYFTLFHYFDQPTMYVTTFLFVLYAGFTSLSGLAAHSRDSRGDLDMMVALVCIIGLNDHTCGKKRGMKLYSCCQFC